MKTPWYHKNDPRMQIEILLLRIGEKNQTMGNKLQRVYQIQKNQQLSKETKNEQKHRKCLGTRRHPRNRHTTKSFQLCRLSQRFYHYRRVFAISIRLPNAELATKTIDDAFLTSLPDMRACQPSYFRTKDSNSDQKSLQN